MTQPQTTTVVIELWGLIGFFAMILGGFATMIWAFVKIILRQLDTRFAERDKKLESQFIERNKKLDEQAEKIAAVDRDVLLLRAELPRNYVQREDWIRFGTTIDTKLDWMREKFDSMREAMHRSRGHDGR
jgi:hypothetical protein